MLFSYPYRIVLTWIYFITIDGCLNLHMTILLYKWLSYSDLLYRWLWYSDLLYRWLSYSDLLYRWLNYSIDDCRTLQITVWLYMWPSYSTHNRYILQTTDLLQEFCHGLLATGRPGVDVHWVVKRGGHHLVRGFHELREVLQAVVIVVVHQVETDWADLRH